MIDERSVIGARARLAPDVRVGPWSIIEEGVVIDAGTIIDSHVIVRSGTRIGCGNVVHPFCVIGGDPQDKKFRGESTTLIIGDRNTIREHCTINRGTRNGGGVTVIGNDNWIMANVHIAHDCQVGNHTVFANNVALAGHVTIEDHVILGGFTAVHQFCRVGAHAFAAIASAITMDVPPYLMVAGNSASACGLNREGLRRHGFSAATIETLKRAYKTLYRSRLTLAQAQGELQQMAAASPEVQRLLNFIAATERGIAR